MSVELYLVFFVASALLVATPGPNVALIVGTSLTHGARTGLTAVAGVNVELVIQLAVVIASSEYRPLSRRHHVPAGCAIRGWWVPETHETRWRVPYGPSGCESCWGVRVAPAFIVPTGAPATKKSMSSCNPGM